MIEATALPATALLGRYAEEPGRAYTDCFLTRVPDTVLLRDFVYAFYTGTLFRMERVILKLAMSRASTDSEAAAVADGSGQAFAAWTVEDRQDEQLLMCDVAGKTRSWFMVEADGEGTILRFGSAVVSAKGDGDIGASYRWMLRLHVLYSRLLLSAARRRLIAGTRCPTSS